MSPIDVSHGRHLENTDVAQEKKTVLLQDFSI